MIDKIKYFSYNNERKRLIKFFFAQLYKEKWLSGRRRTIGNRVYVISVPWVQIPFSPPKNTAEKDTFSAVFFYPSRRLSISSPHEVWWISSALWAVYHHASACIFLRLDEIQNFVLMICNFFEIDDIQGLRLDFSYTLCYNLLKEVILCQGIICS